MCYLCHFRTVVARRTERDDLVITTAAIFYFYIDVKAVKKLCNSKRRLTMYNKYRHERTATMLTTVTPMWRILLLLVLNPYNMNILMCHIKIFNIPLPFPLYRSSLKNVLIIEETRNYYDLVASQTYIMTISIITLTNIKYKLKVYFQMTV